MRKPSGYCRSRLLSFRGSAGAGKSLLLPIAAFAAGFLCFQAGAATPPQPATRQPPAATRAQPRQHHKSLSRQDKKWLKSAHQINLAEIKAGELAEKSAHAHAVRRVGHTLVVDHRMLDAKVMKLAKQLGVNLPGSASLKQKSVLKVIESQAGVSLDKEWLHQEIDGHVAAIEKTKREIHIGSSKQVMQLAKQALPVLEKHLHLLRSAANEMTGGS
ncbi:MAG TPA: DUF4142 domain-containing protein [Gammaproteobacteria bacterium]|nr:DUF4142 domain-containing protein [Gammaproteobacteria bacterium]